MCKKILVVGGVAGGASAAARARRLDEFAEIIMFERGPHVSFSNCSLPYHLSGIVENSADLLLMDPTSFKTKYNIEARINQEVIKINPEEKYVLVKDMTNGREYKESYNKLILSPGANPIVPPIEGVKMKHVFTVRNVVDIEHLYQYLYNGTVTDVAVIGGGFIGVEVAENLKKSNFHVSLIEAADQIMAPFDYDMAQILHKEMIDQGIDLILNDGVQEVTSDYVKLSSGKKVAAQVVIMSIGVRPETTLAKDAGLNIGDLGGIKVDSNYLTNDQDIYAIGDAIEVYHQLTHTTTRLALAGPAQRQARAVADHIYGIPHRNTGVIGSSVVGVFNFNAASTGLNEKTAEKLGISYDVVYTLSSDKVGLMPDASPIHFKLLYEVPTGRVLGAQAVGKGNVDKRIDVIATIIMMKGTLEDLKELELCYSPLYGTAKDIVNHAALVGLNLLHGRFKQINVTKVRELVESNAFILDVREEEEFHKGHLKNAINIPLSQLREKTNDIPKDIPVYLHCRSSQSSYYAIMALQQMGFKNLYNISGSYLGISYFEFFNDQVTGREKIVTNYNFQ